MPPRTAHAIPEIDVRIPADRLARPAAAPGGPFAFVARLIARMRREKRLRRDFQMLSEMDDHLLSDIGLRRDEIEIVVRRRFRIGEAPRD